MLHKRGVTPLRPRTHSNWHFKLARRITFTVNDQLFAELERLSMEDGRSLSNLVAFGIEMYVVQRSEAEQLQGRGRMQTGTRGMA